MVAAARMERVGIPLDTELLARFHSCWDALKLALVEDVDRVYGVFENGVFKHATFAALVARLQLPWPRTGVAGRQEGLGMGRRAKTPQYATQWLADRVLESATTFSDRQPGTAFWYENSNGLAEIAANRGRADELGLAIGSPVEIIP